ncbi:class I SAM-dependent methyltransferase [Nocardioides sp. LHG3406-4]|uniref:class I SAM-dependent methyltransferase n=1 Tax=Nocardioides sp. LHG3406-4 TaxID=2804575 RepID=UPI003CF71C85
MWDDRVLPRLVDRALSAAEIAELRAEACAGLRGRVLEIGFGSGLNVEHYPATVASVSAVEPSDVAWALSADRRSRSAVPVERTGLDGQRLAAPDGSYDGVLSTFTLCTIPDVGTALAEVRRVLRAGGRFHFLEHGHSPDDAVARWQRRLEPMQRRVFGGCHLTRDMTALVAEAGLDVTELRTSYLPGPRLSRPWSYAYLGQGAESA